MTVVDEYLKSVTPGQKQALERVRGIVKQMVPDVEEAISYGMPTFKYKGKYVVYFAAFKKHMSLFPGTLKFTEDKPLPEDVIREVVKDRLRAIEAEKS